jgi:hypothetical protein
MIYKLRQSPIGDIVDTVAVFVVTVEREALGFFKKIQAEK